MKGNGFQSRYRRNYSLNTRQRGTSLLIVMVLLMISTLLGISAMEDSGVTSKMASNDQFREIVFRAAEGKSNKMLSTANVTTVIGSATGVLTDTSGILSNSVTDATLILEGMGLARGFSLGEGVNGFAPYTLTSSATVTLSSINAESTVIQGAQQYAPK